MTDEYLLVTDVEVHYRKSQALFGVSLAAPQTGLVAILGRNGAGKTTLMNAVTGVLKVSSGRILFDGADITNSSPENLARRGVGYVPQEANVFASLSVSENLKIGSSRTGALTDELVYEMFPRLKERYRQRAGTLSGGERKMLAIGRALVGDPKLLLLDEPTEGVWPDVVTEIGQRLADLARSICVVLVEQHVSLALTISDHVYVLERGRVALSGPSSVVSEDPDLYRLLAL